MTINDLRRRFVEIGVAQSRAIDLEDTAKFKTLFDVMREIEDELKSRPGDQREALVSLHGHVNLQVRLNAAKATLAVAPTASRRALEAIQATGWLPQAGDAGMCLWALDKGIFKPS
jgi:hypothetical protein